MLELTREEMDKFILDWAPSISEELFRLLKPWDPLRCTIHVAVTSSMNSKERGDRVDAFMGHMMKDEPERNIDTPRKLSALQLTYALIDDMISLNKFDTIEEAHKKIKGGLEDLSNASTMEEFVISPLIPQGDST